MNDQNKNSILEILEWGETMQKYPLGGLLLSAGLQGVGAIVNNIQQQKEQRQQLVNHFSGIKNVTNPYTVYQGGGDLYFEDIVRVAMGNEKASGQEIGSYLQNIEKSNPGQTELLKELATNIYNRNKENKDKALAEIMNVYKNTNGFESLQRYKKEGLEKFSYDKKVTPITYTAEGPEVIVSPKKEVAAKPKEKRPFVGPILNKEVFDYQTGLEKKDNDGRIKKSPVKKVAEISKGKLNYSFTQEKKQELLDKKNYYEAYAIEHPKSSDLYRKYKTEVKTIIETIDSYPNLDLSTSHKNLIKPINDIMSNYTSGQGLPFSFGLLVANQETGLLSENNLDNKYDDYNIFNIKNSHFLINQNLGESGKVKTDSQGEKDSKGNARKETYMKFGSSQEAWYSFNEVLNSKYKILEKVDFSKAIIKQKYTPSKDKVGRGIIISKDLKEKDIVSYVNTKFKNSNTEKDFGLVVTKSSPTKIKDFIAKDIGEHFLKTNKDKIENGVLKKGKYHISPYVLVKNNGNLESLKPNRIYQFSPHEWAAILIKDAGYATDAAYAYYLQRKLEKDERLKKIIEEERKIYSKENYSPYIRQKYNEKPKQTISRPWLPSFLNFKSNNQ